MPDSADSVYAKRPWDKESPEAPEQRYDYMGPFSSDQQAKITQAISSVTVPAEFLTDIVRPPIPQIQLFRPRYGYRTREIGIADIVNVDEIYAEPRTETGGAAGYSGTSRNTLGNGTN